jgi:hypothetical protein
MINIFGIIFMIVHQIIEFYYQFYKPNYKLFTQLIMVLLMIKKCLELMLKVNYLFLDHPFIVNKIFIFSIPIIQKLEYS